jgi:hypothetical protein
MRGEGVAMKAAGEGNRTTKAASESEERRINDES